MKTKQPKECEEHYFTFYNKSREDPIPVEEDFIVKGRKTVKIGATSIIDLFIDEEKVKKNA